MLTNTTLDVAQDPTQIAAASLAIDDAERHCEAALRDLARLGAQGAISAPEAAALESEALARFTAHARELELRAAEILDPQCWAAYEERAKQLLADRCAERAGACRAARESASTRARRERQMCVVASARVSAELRAWLRDEDDETLAARLDLAAAGLL
jgi:hypothetical protein